MVPTLPDALHPPLVAFLDLLDRWNRIHALTGLPPERRWEELVLDSAALLPRLEALGPGSTVVDLGTGMGIPALVLAVARPDLRILALDRSRKKIAFVRQAVLELGLDNLEPRAVAFQDAGRNLGDLGVAKALAPLPDLLAWWRHLGREGCPLLALKGPEWNREASPAGWRVLAHPYSLPSGGERWVVEARPDATAPRN